MKLRHLLLLSAAVFSARLHAACSMWNMPADYIYTAGSCTTAQGVTLYAPFYSQLVIADPFQILVRNMDLPYRQRSDSPWAAGIAGASIYVEDFEDGQVNTPGLAMMLGVISPGDSVDEDDGILGNDDDLGSYWYAGISGPSLTARAVFAPDDNGNYPTYAGWAMDTFNQEDAFVEAFDPQGNLIASYRYILGWDGWQFVGVHAPQGIGWIQSRFNDNLGIDHVQYGYSIPEPAAPLLALAAGAAALTRRRRGR